MTATEISIHERHTREIFLRVSRISTVLQELTVSLSEISQEFAALTEALDSHLEEDSAHV